MHTEKQTVTILVGLPGSGKTTFYEREFAPEFDVRISQDVLGSKQECFKKTIEVLETGASVVIDRVNFNRNQRRDFINIARRFNAEVYCVYLVVPIDIALERISNRKDHETIKEDMPLEKKKEIIDQFNGMWQNPSIDEGFESILILRNYK